jgi:hypothetical protein
MTTFSNQQQLATITDRIADVATWAHVALVDYGGSTGKTAHYDPAMGIRKIAELQVLFHELHTCLHQNSSLTSQATSSTSQSLTK